MSLPSIVQRIMDSEWVQSATSPRHIVTRSSQTVVANCLLETQAMAITNEHNRMLKIKAALESELKSAVMDETSDPVFAAGAYHRLREAIYG